MIPTAHLRSPALSCGPQGVSVQFSGGKKLALPQLCQLSAEVPNS